MSILDEWAERHIEKALKNGELSSLPGEGKPLVLDDNSHVPESLRASYHLLKNAGFLPPEMQDRKDALSLAEILSSLSETGIKDEQLQKTHFTRIKITTGRNGHTVSTYGLCNPINRKVSNT